MRRSSKMEERNNPVLALNNIPVQPHDFSRRRIHQEDRTDVSDLIVRIFTYVAIGALTGSLISSYLNSHESQPVIQEEMVVPKRYNSDVLRIRLLERENSGLGRYMI